MEVNDNDDKIFAEVVNNIDTTCNDGDDDDSDINKSNAKLSDKSDYESFHDKMDWYHVLHTHGSKRKNELLFQQFWWRELNSTFFKKLHF